MTTVPERGALAPPPEVAVALDAGVDWRHPAAHRPTWLALPHRQLPWRAGLFAAAPAALAAALCGAPVGTVLAAGCAALTGASIYGWILRRWLWRSYHEPLRAVIETVHELRQGVTSHRLVETGAPAVRALIHSLNHASASLDDRGRRGRASLLTVELALERLQSVLRSVEEGVLVLDEGGEIVLANAAARQLLRAGQRGIEGRHLGQVLEGDLRARVVAALARLDAAPATSVHLEGVPFGERVQDVALVRVRSEQGAIGVGTLVVFHDVTRNHEVTRLKDRFLSSVSHELRTPLTNICAFSEILLQMGEGPNAERLEFLGIVQAEAVRLKRIVEDLLDFTNLEAGDVAWSPELLDLGSLVRGAADVMRPLVEGCGLTLDVDVDALLPRVSVDRRRLLQVVSKLLDNAVKFTPRGGRILVRVGLDPDGRALRVGVDDSGPGVPEAERERVFERFHQVGDPLKDKPAGTGLSLAICRRILAVAGGRVWCESSELGGARFVFVVPVETARRG
ncbi:MAG: PAS domain-containing protein [Planctomycetes bacterium]|nr:PAS domain-containing protein [Planctomycetota bacterium]